jgi:hypothetical protein
MILPEGPVKKKQIQTLSGSFLKVMEMKYSLFNVFWK